MTSLKDHHKPSFRHSSPQPCCQLPHSCPPRFLPALPCCGPPPPPRLINPPAHFQPWLQTSRSLRWLLPERPRGLCSCVGPRGRGCGRRGIGSVAARAGLHAPASWLRPGKRATWPVSQCTRLRALVLKLGYPTLPQDPRSRQGRPQDGGRRRPGEEAGLPSGPVLGTGIRETCPPVRG